METKQDILRITRDDFMVIIRHSDSTPDDIYGDRITMEWTDYVANEWSEEYDNLAQALTRCALLLECESSDWELGFKMTSEQHKDMHQAFVEDNL